MRQKSVWLVATGIWTATLACAQPPAPPTPPPATAPSQPPPPPSMDKKTIAAMMQQQGGPGEEHKSLEPLVGRFDVDIKLTIMPGMPPLVIKSRTEAKWILGKRFVQVSSSPAEGEEIKLESLSTFGYDKRHKKFFWSSIDSSDTYPIFAEGDYDKDTKTFTFLGENDEPGMGKVPFKTILKLDTPDSRTMQIWFQFKGAPGADPDGWLKIMESVYTRAK